jgi:hypothetical protein
MKMKKITLKNFLKVCSFSLIFPVITQAQTNQQLTLINHFDKPISYIITINPDVLPDLPKTFDLASNTQISTNVLDLQKQAYLSGKDAEKGNVFFGVEVVDNKLKIHGYIGKNIAYSWKNNVITFCTPEEYKQKHSC